MNNSNYVMSVSLLNEQIKSLLSSSFSRISVEGEISSVTYHNSGHIYFSIKDESSSIKCIMWKSNTHKLKFTLQRGEKIIVNGSINVYTPRGEYQIIASSIEPYGKGALSLAFEQLKEKLSKKGYFDERYKKAIPKYPKKIAIVTAKGGAALQDMLNIASRRWALVDIVVFDTLVQGDGASYEIANAIKRADNYGVDVIIVGRGGGSIEDLWAFNEELVADAIFEASTPIVSAVGHEVDFLISDFVADLRAPTPSAAMELILPDSNELLYTLDDIFNSLNRRVNEIIHIKSERLKSLELSIKSNSAQKRLKLLDENFKILKSRLDEAIEYKLSKLKDETISIQKSLIDTIDTNIRTKESRVNNIAERLTINNPHNKVKEGWGEIIKDGKRVALANISIGEEFEIYDGKNRVRVKVIDKS